MHLLRYFIYVSVLFIAAPLRAVDFDPELLTVIKQGLSLLYAEDLDAAVKEFTKLKEMDPAGPEGHFFCAFSYELFMDEYRTSVYDPIFNIEVEAALQKSQGRVDGDSSGVNLLWLGGTFGLRGVRKGVLGDWWGAFRDGGRSHETLHRAVELDSTLYDAYYGLGMYHYWKSKKLRMVAWLPFIADEREEGLAQIKLAGEKGMFAEIPSKHGLFRIVLEEEKYEEVLDLVKGYSKRYPRDVFHRWYEGIALIRLKRWEEALRIYEEIGELLQGIRNHGKEADVECWYYTALSKYHLRHENADVLALCDKILALKGKLNEKLFYYENYFDKAEDLRDEVD